MENSLFLPSTMPLTPMVTSSASVAFIGNTSDVDAVRGRILEMNLSNYTKDICDLGDVKEEIGTSIGAIIIDQIEANHFLPFVINDPFVDLSNDEVFLDHFFSPAFISNRQEARDRHTHLGVQKHFLPDNFEWLESKHLRLGDIKADPQRVEVFLRNADLISINLNVIRLADNIGHSESCTAGLSIEELAMIAKYAGASPKLKTLLIEGYDPAVDHHAMMSSNIALLYWYFLEGYQVRLRESTEIERTKSYTLMVEEVDGAIEFIENTDSGRWWVRIYSQDADDMVDIPCTKTDYEEACQNEISQRILSILSNV